LKLLVNYLNENFARTYPDKTYPNRIKELLETLSNQYRKLDSPRRKFYYSIADIHNLSRKYTILQEKIDKLCSETKITDFNALSTNLMKANSQIIEELRSLQIESLSIRKDLKSLDSSQTILENNINLIHEKVSNLNLINKYHSQRYVEYIKNRLGFELWNELDKRIQKYLLTAEILYCLIPFDKDFSGAVVEYCKAIELLLNLRLIQRILDYQKESDNINYIHVGTFKLGPNYKTHLTLGSIPYLLSEEWTCEFSSKKYSNKKFNKNLLIELKLYFNSKIVSSELQEIVSIRNKAAHLDEISKIELDYIREKLNIGSHFNEILYQICGLYPPDDCEFANGTRRT
jgi:hypothetical protein